MRLMELGEKEIVNLNNGERLGIIAQNDLLIDENTGKIISLLIPERKFGLRMLGLESSGIEIPWNAIRKIGYDMIIIELDRWHNRDKRKDSILNRICYPFFYPNIIVIKVNAIYIYK